MQKVRILLNQIDGKKSDGSGPAPVPAIQHAIPTEASFASLDYRVAGTGWTPDSGVMMIAALRPNTRRELSDVVYHKISNSFMCPTVKLVAVDDTASSLDLVEAGLNTGRHEEEARMSRVRFNASELSIAFTSR